MPFTGKVALVTGAGQCIGYEICRQLALRGAAVLLNDRDPELAECAAEEIRWEGGNCLACAGDASQIAFIESMVLELRGEGKCPSSGVTGARANALMDQITG